MFDTDTDNETKFNRQPARWLHTKQDATEVLTLCVLDHRYVVQVTTDDSPGADFAGLYEIDGERVNLANGDEWEVVLNNDVAPELVEAVHATWGGGLDESVVRL